MNPEKEPLWSVRLRVLRTDKPAWQGPSGVSGLTLQDLQRRKALAKGKLSLERHRLFVSQHPRVLEALNPKPT